MTDKLDQNIWEKKPIKISVKIAWIIADINCNWIMSVAAIFGKLMSYGSSTVIPSFPLHNVLVASPTLHAALWYSDNLTRNWMLKTLGP